MSVCVCVCVNGAKIYLSETGAYGYKDLLSTHYDILAHPIRSTISLFRDINTII